MYILSSAKPLNFSYGLGCRSVSSAAVICNTRMWKNGRQLEDVPHMTYGPVKDRQLQDGPKRGNLHVTQVCSGDNRFEVVETVNTVPLYAGLPLVEARFSLEHPSRRIGRNYDINDTTNLEVAKSDYNICQTQHQMEWDQMQQWHEEYNLDEEFGIGKKEVLHAYFVAASSISEPERSGERRAWVKSQIISSILSTYYFIKEYSQSSEQPIEFSTVFGVKVRADPDMKGYKDVERIITILFEILNEEKKDARERIGRDTADDLLHEAWGGWLKKQGEIAEDREEIEVLVRVINICGGHMASKEILSLHDYKALSSLTNKICRHLRELQHKKMVDMEGKETEKSGRSKMYEEIDKDMQSLLQLVLQDSSINGISKEIKQTFLMVAKTFYYRAYFPTQQIEHHIAKVIFEQVV